MEPDDLLCSRNARPQKALVGRAQWKINQPPSLKGERASLEGALSKRARKGQGRVLARPGWVGEKIRAVEGSPDHATKERERADDQSYTTPAAVARQATTDGTLLHSTVHEIGIKLACTSSLSNPHYS